MIQGMFDYGALPSLERLVQFTGQRHRVLTDNIANLSTPYYKPRDLDPKQFQQELARAIDDRRDNVNPVSGPLDLRDTRQLKFQSDSIQVKAQQINENILFHDQNNRDVDRLMQRLAENTLAHKTGIDLVRNEFGLLRTAISGRL